jgi:hypothetical protein
MKCNLSSVVGGLCLLFAGSSYGAVVFNPFVTNASLASGGVGGIAPIGFAYAGDKFVGSNYFNNQLYQTDLTGGNVKPFGAPLPIASGAIGEIYVSSSLGLGGFGSREVFAGSEAAGTVYRYANDGSGLVPFATGLIGDVRGIGFDPYGQYGYDMIVTTQLGNVYRVNSAGTPTLLKNVGGDAEGLDFTPQQFGNIPAGTLVVLSEGTGRINAITPGGVKSDLGLAFNTPEMLSFVPLNLGISGNSLEGFYAANYSVNVIKAGASEFGTYLGEAILTEETTHRVFRIYWDGTAFQKQDIGGFPNQPEDGIFVTAAILNPGCEVTNTCGSRVPEPTTLALLGIAAAGLTWRRRRK